MKCRILRRMRFIISSVWRVRWPHGSITYDWMKQSSNWISPHKHMHLLLFLSFVVYLYYKYLCGVINHTIARQIKILKQNILKSESCVWYDMIKVIKRAKKNAMLKYVPVSHSCRYNIIYLLNNSFNVFFFFCFYF